MGYGRGVGIPPTGERAQVDETPSAQLGSASSRDAPHLDSRALLSSPQGVLALQRAAGNRAVRAALRPRASVGDPVPRSVRVLDRVRRLQRLTTWGGEWKTRRYKDLLSGADKVGVDIEIEFIPNENVNASGIGLVQTAMSQSGGVAPFRDPAVDPEWAGRSIDKGPNLGLGIDQLSGFVNPLYITTAGAAGDTLNSTATLPPDQPGGGRHGWRTVDSKGVEHKRSALMNDTPQLPVANNSKQEFETTALATSGAQIGTYYGSVRWGWRRDAAGTFTRLPFTKKSDDAPSWLFNTAAGLWNRSKTAAGVAHVRLPTAVGRWVGVADSQLVEDPGAATPNELAKLDVKDRVEVTNRGTGRPFNTGAVKWWKITVVSGTHVGSVGWTLASNLTDVEPT
jgi:hypothetical protein